MVAVQTRNRQMPKISRVKLLKKIKISTSAGATWTLVPALFDSKGRVRRDHVTVAGQDEVHAEGSYYLEWWEGGKSVSRSRWAEWLRRCRQGAGEAGRVGRRAQRDYSGTACCRSSPRAHDAKACPRCVQGLRSLPPLIANLPLLYRPILNYLGALFAPELHR